MKIRKYLETDWAQVLPIVKKEFSTGETYPYSPNVSENEVHKIWIETPRETYVAVDENNIIYGTYYIKPNQPKFGAHVCNCGYIVPEKSRGKGIARIMCKHSQKIALELGFRAMQFNLVVATNEAAIHLWKKLGFHVIGRLPEAFNSKTYGYVDAFVMYKILKQ